MRAFLGSIILGFSLLGVSAARPSFSGSASHRRRSSAFVAAPMDIISEQTLWAIRAASAVSSYIGFVAFFDRPQGVLNVSSQVESKPSTVPGAGLGLFATTEIRKNTVLGTYPGVVLPLKQNLVKLKQYPGCEGYIWRFSDNESVIDPTNHGAGVLDPVCSGGNPSLPGSIFLFQTVLRWMNTVPTTLCLINEPPIGKDVNVVTDEDRDRRCVTFTMERDVFPGEELFLDYGLSYDRSMYGGSVDKRE